MNYGEKVRYAMKKAGKKSGEVAEYVGVSQAMISKVINGNSAFAPDNLKKFAKFVNTPIDFFIKDNHIPLDEMMINERIRLILTGSNTSDYIVLADTAKKANITPAELEKAINFIIEIKKQGSR